MDDFEIAIGYHGATLVPLSATNDINPPNVESVGVANHGADVKIMIKVFNGDFKRRAASVQVVDDCLVGPVTIFVDHISAVTVCK